MNINEMKLKNEGCKGSMDTTEADDLLKQDEYEKDENECIG